MENNQEKSWALVTKIKEKLRRKKQKCNDEKREKNKDKTRKRLQIWYLCYRVGVVVARKKFLERENVWKDEPRLVDETVV